MNELIQGLFWVFLTVYHEARGESDLGQKNVVKVIMNRAHRSKWPVENVVKARKQFSCYNDGLYVDKVTNLKELQTANNVLRNVLLGSLEWHLGFRLGGATHYYAIKGMETGKPPYWAEAMSFICEEEGHRFLKEN